MKYLFILALFTLTYSFSGCDRNPKYKVFTNTDTYSTVVITVDMETGKVVSKKEFKRKY
jgi:hypothetical protein